MYGYSLDIIFPMLQFLAVHAGYTLFWVTLSAIISDVRQRLPACIALGGISAVIHQDLLGLYYSAMFHLVVALTFMVAYVVRKLLTNDDFNWTNNLTYVADLGEQEKNILGEIDNLSQSGQLSESSLEKIYNENKEFIDSSSILKYRIFNEVIKWRKEKGITCRAVTVNGQRQFLNVNFRSVDWLK